MNAPILGHGALDRARSYVAAHGRPLERARLSQLLGEVHHDDVTDALQSFANSDGGMGNALESDCRAPQSSALAALTALDIMRMHDVPGNDPLMTRVCSWLVEHVQDDGEGRLVWPFLPPDAQDSAHAPWWDQSEPGQLAAMFSGYVANPGVALTAHLWRRERAAAGSIPGTLLARLTEQAEQVARDGVSAQEVNAHDALAHLAGEDAVPEQAREAVTAYLRSVLPGRVLSSEQGFAGYGIHPLWIAPEPNHPLAASIADQLELALDYTVRSQETDGSWAPSWSWGAADPQSWAVAEREWRGALIVRNVEALMAHGRVAAH